MRIVGRQRVVEESVPYFGNWESTVKPMRHWWVWLLPIGGMLIGCSGPATPQNQPIPAELAPYLAETGNPTLNYWNKVNVQLVLWRKPPKSDTGPSTQDLSAVGACAEFCAYALMQLPTEGVDDELIAWSLAVVTSKYEFSRMADFSSSIDRDANSSEVPAGQTTGVLHRHLLGAHFGSRWFEQELKIRQQGAQLQQVLTQKYGQTVPPCQF